MPFNQITNLDLTNTLKQLCKEEKKLLSEVLGYIAEVDRRQIYLSMGYPSLFEFLVKEISYSPSSAQRRIDGARLLRQVPELGEKIENGTVSLVQISKMQKAIREVKKATGQVVSQDEKKELLFKIENQTPQKTETIIAQTLGIEPIRIETRKFQKDESVRLELTLTKTQMEKLEEARALLSNTLPQASLVDVITFLAEKLVKSKTHCRAEVLPRYSPHSPSCGSHDDTEKQFLLVKMGFRQHQAKPISQKTKKIVFARDQFCQYQDPRTGAKCGSKHFLHVDHINARLFGGGNDPQNLRLLCSSHHRMRHQS